MTKEHVAMLHELMIDLGLDQTAIGNEVGVTQSTISRWMKGKIELSATKAKRIEALYHKTKGQPLRANTLPSIVKIVGRVGAGAEVMPEFEQLPPEGLFEVEIDFPIKDGALAFEVEGLSMHPRFAPGDVIICWEQASDHAQAVGWEAAVMTEDGRRFIKTVRAGGRSGLFDLESHNAPMLRDQSLIWIYRINLIVPRSGWMSRTRKAA